MDWFRRFRVPSHFHWGLWIALTTGWTILLVIPTPEEVTSLVPIAVDVKFYIAKSLHFGVYTFLTGFAGWLQPPFRWRLLLLFFLMAHAGVTELIQRHVPSRTGTVEDVVLDHVGIAVGLILGWKWWSRA